MKITMIKKEVDGARETWSLCDLERWLCKLKKETKSGYISQLRQVLPQLEGSDCHFVNIGRIPCVYPAVTYQRTSNGERKFKSYNGIVQLEVNRLSGWTEVEHIKEQVSLLPQTLVAFAGSSGKSVKIWVLFSLPDGTLPQTEEQAQFFHAHAYRLAVKCYQPMLPFSITLKEPTLQQHCRMSVDERPYYNPKAVPFCLEQPLSFPGHDTFRERKQAEANPLLRVEHDYESYRTFGQMFQAALKRVLSNLENWKRGDDLMPLLVHLGEECYKAGIPEEEAVRRTLMHYYYYKDEQLIRSTFHNLYDEMKGFGERPALTKEQETALRLEEFIHRRYEFRFNTVLDDLEYRERNSVNFYFRPVDKRVRNEVIINALKEGLQVWDRDVDRYLNSSFVPQYNPVEEYLFGVGRWDGKDRIRPLADCVPTNQPHWRELFHRWFLGMVAHWRGMDKQRGNATTPILIGAQGYRKSTFCRILLPPELRFGYTDSLNFSSKLEAERCLGRFFLINLDEFDQISVTQQAYLKHLLQKPAANLRKPYGTAVREMRRYASFIATTNQKDVLTDPSGNRRYICVEVTAPIDTNITINYEQLYAQAMHEVLRGERYWLDDKDEALLKESNREFEQVSPLEQLFFTYFEAASPHEKDGEWMTVMDIFNYLQSKSKDKLPINKVNLFGRSLQKWNLVHKRVSKGSLYYLKKR